MPNYYMTAKDPNEVRAFFKDLVDQGKLKVILATERPDVYDRITPSEEIRLVVDTSDKTPPEGVDFDKVLPEFRPTPIPEDQMKSWSDEITPDESEQEPSDKSSVDELETTVIPADVTHQTEEDTTLLPADVQGNTDGGVLDKKWTPFSSRGFKG